MKTAAPYQCLGACPDHIAERHFPDVALIRGGSNHHALICNDYPLISESTLWRKVRCHPDQLPFAGSQPEAYSILYGGRNWLRMAHADENSSPSNFPGSLVSANTPYPSK